MEYSLSRTHAQHAASILFGMAVACAGLVTLTVTPALAVPVQSLPPDIQQWLRSAWARLPADARQQDIVAIQALSPAQAEKAITNVRNVLRSVPMDVALQLVLRLDKIRTSVPPASRQAFVNGGWGVSPAEEQFAQQVMQAAIARLQAQQGGSRSTSDDEERKKWQDWRREQDNYLCSWNSRPAFCRERR